MLTVPEEITVCLLQCIIMPNGEIISNGKTVGYFRDYKGLIVRQKDVLKEK